MNQKRLFKGLAISIALIIVVGIFILQEVTELPTPTSWGGKHIFQVWKLCESQFCYAITLGPGNTATVEKRMFPIEVVF